EFGNAAMFAALIQGRIKDPVVQTAFDYWATMTSLDKWLALPPRTPEPIVRAYRTAYEAASGGSEFVELGRRISEDLEPRAYDDVPLLVERLGRTPPEAAGAIGPFLRRQGIEAEYHAALRAALSPSARRSTMPTCARRCDFIQTHLAPRRHTS